MKLHDKDIIALLDETNDHFVEGKDPIQEITSVSNRIQKIRNSTDVKHEDHKIYGNKDKTRLKY